MMFARVKQKMAGAPAAVRDAWNVLCRRTGQTALLSLLILIVAVAVPPVRAHAASVSFDLGGDGTQVGSQTLQLLFLFVALAVAPFLLLMMTSFTRIVIVFSFLRSAIGLQSTPPNQVIIGLALSLTMFIMMPVFTQVNEVGIQPLMNNEITAQEAIDRGQVPLKEFMLKQTKTKDLKLFLSISGTELPAASDGGDTVSGDANIAQLEALSLSVIVPAFVTSELERAFMMGFLLYLPFLVIDMIVSSTLMSMGMVMLPPSTIAMPFKLLLFVLVDGWGLIMDTLVRSFR
mgnify:CR=1 FL=1